MDDLDGVLRFARKAAYRYAHTPLGYDDAVGVGYLAVAEALGSYDPRQGVPFGAYAIARIRWALASAARCLHSARNGPDIIVVMDPQPDEDKARAPNPFDQLAREDEYHVVYQVVMRLPEPVREVVILIASGWSGREVAARFGVHETRISQHLAVARRVVADALGVMP